MHHLGAGMEESFGPFLHVGDRRLSPTISCAKRTASRSKKQTTWSFSLAVLSVSPTAQISASLADISSRIVVARASEEKSVLLSAASKESCNIVPLIMGIARSTN